MRKLALRGLVVLITGLTLATPAVSEYLHVEDSGFTRLPVSARAIGMGGAFTAVSDDYSACYYNPAGLVNLSFREFGSMYTRLYGLEELAHSYLSFIEPNTGMGSGGISWSHLSADLEPGEWNYDLWAYSYAQHLLSSSSWGVNLKYLRQSTSWEDATGYSMDFGYMIKGEKISWGVCGRDLFSRIDWGTKHRDTLPLNVTAGIAFNPNSKILVALDTEFSSQDLPQSVHLGAEFGMGKYFFLRAGLINKFQSDDTLTYSAGLGIKVEFGEIKNLSFDYAFLSPQKLSSAHYFSLAFTF